MAGLYIHVPFCKKRCIYCDFFSTVYAGGWHQKYADQLGREMLERRAEAKDKPLETIYLGGGTPSQLPPEILSRIFASIQTAFTIAPDAEITLEANPDDVTEDWLSHLRADTPVNRLSMGVQTFSDTLLHFLGRRHTSKQAAEAISLCRQSGYHNISIDLIYGIPGQSMEQWQSVLQQVLDMGIQHLRAYALQFEPGTRLYDLLEKGEVDEVNEELQWLEYEYLMDETQKAGFEHYEISNFALPAYRSRHNSSYWRGDPYIGIGPGSHSFDGSSTRRHNLHSLERYVNCPPSDIPFESEVLSEQEKYEERVMTALRTSEGLDLRSLTPQDRAYCLRMAQPHLLHGKLLLDGDTLRLTREGIFVSNDILSDLMY